MNKPSNTTTWFLTSGYDVTPIQVIRSTEKCVYLWNDSRKCECRELISSSYYKYFPTREEAEDHIRKKCENSIKAAESTIARCRAALAKLSPKLETP